MKEVKWIRGPLTSALIAINVNVSRLEIEKWSLFQSKASAGV